ncbi:MAG: hypothetical protein ABIO40_11900 [Devosia sp.]
MKTGSTYIQSILQANRATLAKHGLCYPDATGEVGFAHHSVFTEMATSHGISPSLRKYLAEIEASGLLGLISSEMYIELPEDSLRLLQRSCRSQTMSVLYLRSAGAFLASVAQEEVKHGKSDFTKTHDAFGDYLRKVAADPASNPRLQFSAMVEKAVRVFGRDRLALVSYEVERASGRDFAVSFLEQVIGVSASGIDLTTAYPNARVDLPTQEFNRLINGAVRACGEEPDVWLHTYLTASLTWKSLPWLGEMPRYAMKAAFDLEGAHARERRNLLAKYGDLFLGDDGSSLPDPARPLWIEWYNMTFFLHDNPDAWNDALAVARRAIAFRDATRAGRAWLSVLDSENAEITSD